MIVSDLRELRISQIHDRGIPNKECFSIYAHQRVDLGRYGIMLGSYINPTDGAFPFRDNMFWFGNGYIEQGDWIFVFTGEGSPSTIKASNNINNIYSVYWGRRTTLFANTNVVPVLFRVDAVDVLAPPDNLPQIGGPGA